MFAVRELRTIFLFAKIMLFLTCTQFFEILSYQIENEESFVVKTKACVKKFITHRNKNSSQLLPTAVNCFSFRITNDDIIYLRQSYCFFAIYIKLCQDLFAMNDNIFISSTLLQFHFWCCTKSAVNTQQKKSELSPRLSYYKFCRFYLITPSSLPTLVNAAMHLSRWAIS